MRLRLNDLLTYPDEKKRKEDPDTTQIWHDCRYPSLGNGCRFDALYTVCISWLFYAHVMFTHRCCLYFMINRNNLKSNLRYKNHFKSAIFCLVCMWNAIYPNDSTTQNNTILTANLICINLSNMYWQTIWFSL